MKVGVLGGKRGEMEKLPRCKNMRIASPTSTLDKTTPAQERYVRSSEPYQEHSVEHIYEDADATAYKRIRSFGHFLL